MTTTTIPSMERLSEVYAEHIGELDDLLAARFQEAESLGIAELEEAIAKAQKRLAGLEGKNEDDRKANLLLALEDDPSYHIIALEVQTRKEHIASLDIAIELKRQRMRLLGWQMEWLIAQHYTEDVETAVAAERVAWKVGEQTR